MNYKFRFLGIIFSSILLTTNILGNPTGTLRGSVTDANGAAIAGARVEATNLGTNQIVSVTTNDDGIYVVPELQPGRYRVRVSKNNFQTVVREQVTVNVATMATVNFALAVGEISETVTVENTATELVEKNSAAVGTLVDRQFVENLPLNGRSFQTLIELTPGVVLTPASTQSTGQFSVNGQRSNANYFTVDGVSANVGTSTNFQFSQQAAGTLPGLTVFGGTTSLASVDAVQEFRVQTSSMEAEFGRQPGGQISLVTRSGTNDLSFSLFEYFRNEALDANDWFDNRAGRDRRALRQNNFGGTVGGPVFLPRFGEGTPFFYDGRNRTFFFFSYEGLRLKQPQTNVLTARVPSLAARASAPEPFRQILNAFPLPNAPAAAGDPADTGRYVAALSYPSQVDATSVRVDHQLTGKINLFGRFNEAPSSQRFRSFASQENAYESNLRTLTLGSTWIVSPKVVNDFRVNFSRTNGLFEFVGVPVDGAILPPDGLLFPAFAPRDNTSVSVILNTGNFAAGLSSANLTQGRTVATKQRQFNAVENLTVVAGNHTLKFGADFRRLTPQFASRSLGITYNFATEASRRTGVPSSIQIQALAPTADFYVDNFSLYGQDTWRASKRLTLTYGLRWELNPPLKGDRLPYQIQGLDNPLTATLAPANTRQWETTYDNFAPRVGVAYTLSEKQDLVARAGFGIFYDLGTGTALRGYSSFPYNSLRTITNPAQLRFPANPADLQPAPFLDTAPPPYNSDFSVFDPQLKLPFTRQWNVSIEKGLGENQSVTISYVGAQGRRLLRLEQLRNYNAAFAAQRFGLPARPIVQINPALFGPTNLNDTVVPTAGSPVSVTRNGTTSDYHALQAQFQRRLSKGLQILASYTYGKALDDVSDETITGIPESDLILSLERGAANFDVRHNFIAAVSYEIPTWRANNFTRAAFGGWAIDSIIRARTGLPFSVISQTFDILNIGTTRRVDLIGGVPVWLEDERSPGGRRLNPAAFAVPAPGRQGTLGRNVLRSFGHRQIDFAVRRSFALTEKLRLQFRAEAFNLFNTPNFSFPAASFGFPGFGEATAMLGRGLSGNTGSTQTSPSPGFNSLYQVGGPRSLQFSFKILY
jgi:hypothetical protein